MNHTRLFRIALALSAVLLLPTARAATLVWTNTAGGNWTNASNWEPNGVPVLADTAVITNAGNYTVTISSAVNAATLLMGQAETNATGIRALALTAGSLTLTNATLETNAPLAFSGGTLTVRGLMQARGDFAWTAGTLTGGGQIQAGSANGVLSITGAGAKTLSGLTLANYSPAAVWSGANPTVNSGAAFQNWAVLTLTNDQTFAHSSGAATAFDNFGTLFKNGGGGALSLSPTLFRSSGSIVINSGNLSLTSVTATNTGNLNFAAGTKLLFNSGTLWFDGQLIASSADTLQFIGGTVNIVTPSLFAPAALIAGATVVQQTNIYVPTINQSAGTFQLLLAASLANYNLTNGILRGGTLTATNFNWTDGGLYASTNGDKLIIPATGTFNLLGAAEKSLYYFAPANQGYGIDNYGTWNWSGGCILRGFNSTVNNYGSVNLTAAGNPYYSYYPGFTVPTWNNFGTFTKTVGTGIFYFNSARVSNSGSLDAQTGTLSFNNAIFGNAGTISVTGTELLFNGATGTNSSVVSIGAATLLTVDGASDVLFAPAASLTAPTANSVRFTAGTTTLQTTNIATPNFLINGGTLFQQAPNVVNAVNQSSGVWWLTLATAINNYNLTNGTLRGGTLTATNFNWTDGGLYANTNGDKLIIPATGTFNLLGAAEKSLYYYAPANQGYGIDNYGTWNWSGGCILRGFNSTVNNYGSVNLTAGGNPYYSYYPGFSAPTWNNFGTFTKTVGTGIFYFNAARVNNAGTFNMQAGSWTLNTSTVFTNSANVTIGAAAVFNNDTSSESTFLSGSSLTAPTGDSVRIPSGTMNLQTTNIATPSFLINGGTLSQQAPNVVNSVNQSSGVWWLTLATVVNNYNLTNGTLRGGTLTATNFNWTDGGLYANTNGDKLIIPATGTFNLLGTAEKSLYYYAPANQGYGIDNYGTWNWSGGCILRGFNSTVNNYGSVNLTAAGNPYYSYYPGFTAPTWNNSGTFTKTAGTGIFYFNAARVNNAGTFNMQAGTWTLSTSTVFTNSANVTVGAAAVLNNDTSSESTFLAGSTLTAPTGDSVRIPSGTVYLQTTNVATPSLLINGGTLFQQAPNVVNTINQTAGAWRLNLTTTANIYNLSAGELRGGTLTVTNLNWTDGNLNADANGDKTIIPLGGVLNQLGNASRFLSYNAPATFGRLIDNYGTWNWTSNSILYALNSGATVNNYGTVNVTGAIGNPQYASYPGYTVPKWNNFATFTKSTGSGIFYFSGTLLNNSGLLDAQAGTLSINTTTFTNSSTVNVGASALFANENGSQSTFLPGSTLTAPTGDSVRIPSGTVYLQTTNVATPSLLINGGTLFQQAPNVVNTINQAAGAWRLNLATTANIYNLSAGELRGGTLTVTNLNWTDGNLNADANGDKTIIPLGGVLNQLGNASRFLSYNAPATFGRNLDNYGTWNWTSNSVLYALNSGATVNNYGTVNVTSATGNPQYASYPGYTTPAWNNLGTLAKGGSNSTFLFNGLVLNNTGLLNAQAGTLSISGSTFTNLSGGNVLAQPGAVLVNESSGTSVFAPGSSLGLADTNAFRIPSGTVTLLTTAITAPSLWINGGTLVLATNNVVPTINESAGLLRLAVPANIPNFNLTNGELRGANLTVDNFNWLGGNLNSDGTGSNLVTVANALNISGANAKTLSYYTLPGRSLINNGTATWGGVSITGQGTATLRNNGTLTLTNDLGLAYGGSGGASIFHNTGTFTKSFGTGVANFSGTTVTNSGTVNINSGGLTVGGPFVQTAGSAFVGTNFTASSSVRVEAGSLTGRGTIAGTFYNNGVLNPGVALGFLAGTSFTNTAAATYNVELGGSTAPGTNYDQLRFSAPVTLDGTLNVTLVNGFAPILSNRFTVLTTSARSGTFASVVPPPGVILNTIYNPTNVILEVTGLTNAPLLILTNPASQTIWTPDPVTFSVAVSGVTPIAFQWQFNSNNIAGATNLNYTIPAVTTNDAGLYSVLITDGNGGTTNVSATLTVVPFANTIYWTNLAGGNWSVPANWLPNRVPVASNNVVIVSNGTYTVNVDIPAACSNLTVGAGSSLATQTVHLVSGQSLNLGGSSTWSTNTLFQLNGTLQMAGGSNDIAGRVEWQLGTLSGAGRTVVRTNATVLFVGSLNQKFIATNILENFGTLTYGGDSFGNAQLLRFSGGAQLTNHPSGLIYMGANALQYNAATTPRSYLVNLGTITAGSANVFSPSYISVDFLNYGTLTNNGYIYLSRGTNFGTVVFVNTLCELSPFGDETAGEYFSFEDGTVFIGAYPALAIGGYAQWSTTTVHPGKVTVLSGSGGASFANPEFRVLKNYTQTGQTIVYKGRWTQANPSLTADLNELSDSLVNGFHTFTITNAGTLRVNNLSHTVRNLGNSGTILVRSNLALTGSSYTYGGGSILITNNATGTFSGGTVEAQFIDNRGTNTVNGAMAFTGSTHFYNRSGARTWFGGGSFGTGPASLLNEGLLDGYGGLSALNVTNRSSVLANDSLNRNLGLGQFIQESGLTDINPGAVSGSLDIRGGLLTGTNVVTGTLRNAAQFAPGKPFGLLSVTGNHTNAATGTHFLPIQGAAPITGFPQTRVTGTAALAGTLYVNFTNGFTPAPGNLFTAMTFAARSGVFDAIVNDTYGLEAFYTSTTLVLRAENLLPNVNLVLPPGGTNFVCQPFRLDANASDPDGVVTNLTLTFDGSPLAASSGAPIFGIVEKDFPSVNAVVATAIDDRGGVRSVTQNLSLVTAPLEVLMLGGIRSNTTFKICMNGWPGTNYTIVANTNLLTTNWVSLGLMERTNGIWRFFDANTITNLPRRYYRAVRQP